MEVRYKVYARDQNVQGNWVDASHAMLNGAPNFMTLVGGEKRPYQVQLHLAKGWTKSISGMKNGTEPNSWVAADFDELLDSPVYAGNAPIHEFDVSGRRHYLVNEGENGTWDGAASAAAVAKIVAEYARQWGGLPYEKYVFFNMMTEGGGGLEHKNSTWLGTSKWAWSNANNVPGRPSQLSWLGLVSHEYFHVWNVKRLRPVELGPFEYEHEVRTPSLWVAEGFTSYYGSLGLVRAKLATRDNTLASYSGMIAQLQTTPGHAVTPIETASADAWIGLYRPSENSANTTISYYTKGAVMGLLLDARIRHLTNGEKTLDDAMKVAFERYGGARGYTRDEFRAVCSEVAGADLSAWFHQAAETTAELDYTEMLDWYGLRFQVEKPRADAPRRILTGITVAPVQPGRIVISSLRRGTPAYEAGFNVDDEILAVAGYRVRAEQWPARLEAYPAGETVDVLVARREKLITLKLKITADATPSWRLEVRPDANDEQKAHLKAWLRE
jgi:predicted metalloprotease with PDZ domain